MDMSFFLTSDWWRNFSQTSYYTKCLVYGDEPDNTGLYKPTAFCRSENEMMATPRQEMSDWHALDTSRELVATEDMLSELPEVRSTRYASRALEIG